MDKLVFEDVRLKEVPVEIAGKQYILFEATEGAAVQWRNASIIGSTMQGTGKDALVKFGGLADSEPVLVSLCLYRCGADGTVPRDLNGAPLPAHRVGIDWIRGWPVSLVKRLFAAVKELSPGLEEKTEEGKVADPTTTSPGVMTDS